MKLLSNLKQHNKQTKTTTKKIQYDFSLSFLSDTTIICQLSGFSVWFYLNSPYSVCTIDMNISAGIQANLASAENPHFSTE